MDPITLLFAAILLGGWALAIARWLGRRSAHRRACNVKNCRVVRETVAKSERGQGMGMSVGTLRTTRVWSCGFRESSKLCLVSNSETREAGAEPASPPERMVPEKPNRIERRMRRDAWTKLTLRSRCGHERWAMPVRAGAGRDPAADTAECGECKATQDGEAVMLRRPATTQSRSA
jgi:hypothetical protein